MNRVFPFLKTTNIMYLNLFIGLAHAHLTIQKMFMIRREIGLIIKMKEYSKNYKILFIMGREEIVEIMESLRIREKKNISLQ